MIYVIFFRCTRAAAQRFRAYLFSDLTKASLFQDQQQIRKKTKYSLQLSIAYSHNILGLFRSVSTSSVRTLLAFFASFSYFVLGRFGALSFFISLVLTGLIRRPKDRQDWVMYSRSNSQNMCAGKKPIC